MVYDYFGNIMIFDAWFKTIEKHQIKNLLRFFYFLKGRKKISHISYYFVLVEIWYFLGVSILICLRCQMAWNLSFWTWYLMYLISLRGKKNLHFDFSVGGIHGSLWMQKYQLHKFLHTYSVQYPTVYKYCHMVYHLMLCSMKGSQTFINKSLLFLYLFILLQVYREVRIMKLLDHPNIGKLSSQM